MPFVPHNDDDLREMMKVIGISDLHELFDEIPESIPRAKLDGIPNGMTEHELVSHMTNRSLKQNNACCFLGAGAYDHYIPASIWSLISRGELYSPYTPYQPESSQGTLQVLFEFQSMISELTGMDVSNASLYDGPTALAEAILMSCRINSTNRSRKIIVPRSLHPHYFETIKTLTNYQDVRLSVYEYDKESGKIALNKNEDPAQAIVVSQPNFFGCLEDVDELTNWAHSMGMLVIAVVNPISLGILTPPGKWGENGADIVVGEAQPLGIPLCSGGPFLGFITSRDRFVRHIPGRLVGYTTDSEQRPCYVLTLQAREQHIRRGKATSNICTNQGLLVNAVVQYLSLIGGDGLRQVALACHQRASALSKKILSIEGVNKVFSSPFFNEFVISLPVPPSEILKSMRRHNILPGYNMSMYYPEIKNPLLVCATEKRTLEEIHDYAKTMQSIISGDVC
ncbi:MULTISPECIES: aminomethyl-transferring glycine dehydrogenase subunit GcvPA [Candidatus Ichthyocystis]|uniref:aminomethyl-transferring glycine dehydrogenase subunit GcvPA n=1 Tax=Candidatus Ichthyocystis TaxID=2929841 RepID=UPI000B23B3FF|nr:MULTISPECIES: aminomethyl-transferring glycine dehydrogenase subunit GcvPA [Ichthyocystis]